MAAPIGTGWGQFTVEMMLSRNEPIHGRLRGSVAEAFTPRAVNRLRNSMQKTVAELLDTAWEHREQGEVFG